MSPYSVEITPREAPTLPPLAELLAPDTAVYLTFLPNTPWHETVAVARTVREAGMRPVVHLAARAGRLSDHDVLIGRLLARAIAGGSLAHATTVSEARMLDLEREAFLKLCGEPKTLERIQHMLKTGKPLRN